jgi:hypothetical protein
MATKHDSAKMAKPEGRLKRVPSGQLKEHSRSDCEPFRAAGRNDYRRSATIKICEKTYLMTQ